ncbi:MAG: SMC-Scp complex subunit ScpB [Eubacteriales bacterium]|nr:SMC-Scp complex subunit ScpB [Eubacteriales bacterium]
MNNNKEILKATLFVAGEGVEKSVIKEKLELNEKQFNSLVDELKQDLSGDSGIILIEYKNKLQLCTNQKYVDIVSDILNPIREKALTKATLETVAIIAYKQPITKLEIEEIRNTRSADYAVQMLLDNKLIEVVGRKDAVGKPFLYGTTDEFLKRFNLKDIKDLPSYEDLLERIKLIREETEVQQTTDSLYRDHEISQEEIVPEFLKGEDIQTIESDEPLPDVINIDDTNE